MCCIVPLTPGNPGSQLFVLAVLWVEPPCVYIAKDLGYPDEVTIEILSKPESR